MDTRLGRTRVCFIAWLVCASVMAPALGSGADDDVDTFLKEFVTKRERMRDYSANFKQTKVSTLFDETEVSTGRVYYQRPGKILWDYRSPDVMKVLVKERVLSIYIAELEQLEIYDFTKEKKLRGLFLGFDESPEELKELYDISLVESEDGDTGACVKLVPKTEDLRAYFDSVTIWLRPKDFAIYKILIVDPKVYPEDEEQDTTLIELGGIRVNRGVREDLFTIEVPEGTEIIRQPVGEEQLEEEPLQPGETLR
jgi:outer membrane lipoprotein carrier protein